MNPSAPRKTLRFSKAHILTATIFATFAGACFAQVASPAGNPAAQQTNLPKLTYDVVSIRPADVDPMRGFNFGFKDPSDKAIFESVNNPVQSLIGNAYGERRYEIKGAPGWALTKYWVIQAKSDEDATGTLKKLDSDQARAVKKQMLRQLLKDRFHLEVHSITEEAQTYDLVVSRKGPKIQESQAKTPNYGMRCGADGCTIDAAKMSMKTLTRMLGGQVSSDVNDKTGLTGIYDFKLSFRPSSGTGMSDDQPLIFTAVEEQLGLKLVPTKGLKQVIVIDHVEMPTEN